MDARGLESGIYPLSYGQQALWFFSQGSPGSPAFNIAFTARIRSAVNVPALRRALQRLIDRHESMRTTFPVPDGRPVQEVHLSGELCFRETDASDWTSDELYRGVRESYGRPFHLEKGPLIRVELFRRAEQDHVMLLSAHLIVCDPRSLSIILDNLRMLYAEEVMEQTCNLGAPGRQYADFIRWQAKMLEDPEGEKQWAYWKEKLSGALPTLDLRTDRPRLTVQTFRGATHPFRISRELAVQLDELSENRGASLSMVLLAALHVLLYRYTGQDDILIGCPVDCRNHTENAGIVGYLLNQVVIRADLSANPVFGAFLDQIRIAVMEASAHQYYPLPLLAERLNPVRDFSRPPLFQVEFIFQGSDGLVPFPEAAAEGEAGTRGKWGAIEMEPFEITQQEGQMDLILEVAKKAVGSLSLAFKYNTDLFDSSTISCMAEHFRTLLESIAAGPAESISELQILTETERHKLLVEWNDTKKNYPRDKCIHELFEEQVERSPRAIAVVFHDKEMTYRELNDRADQLARYLRTLGVGPETMVGICVERSMEMVVGLLGVLKAGGAYVPLDPKYPVERLEFMIEDTAVPVILTQRHLVAMMPKTSAKVACLDADPEVFAGGDERNPATAVTPADIAYVIYTSGSTGRPKGVMISHRALCNHMVWMQEAFPLVSADKVLQKTLFTFDASVWEFFAPLLAGAMLIVAGPEDHRDSVRLTETIKKHQVTVLQVVPALLNILIEENAIDQCGSLKRVFCGGEVLPVRLSERFLMSTNADLINLYGPTEACIDVTFRIVPRGQENDIASIGRPVANTKAYILDRFLQPVPTGVPGELCISGDGLARGYLNRPDLTAEKFIPNPFSEELGARLYMTGDLARYLPDGDIEYLGRIDNQVKIRGFRIELGEVEAVLAQHKSVNQAVVIAKEDSTGDRQLIAYAVLAEASTLSSGELREFLGEKLPDYMIPSFFIFLDALPLTPNGKIDRKALPAPDKSGLTSQEDFVSPSTPTEEIIAGIWADVLGLKLVGIYDNFFELGGHSLLATQAVSRLNEALRVRIPLQSIFETPTVNGLSKVIEKLFREAQDSEIIHEQQLIPISRMPPNKVPMLSFAQERLWFFDQMEPLSTAYNICSAIRLTGWLNVRALQESLHEIVRRHEVLRATFESEEGHPVQVFHAANEVEILQVDLGVRPETDREAEAMKFMSDEVKQPFDLARGPLLRAMLLKLSDREHILQITIHHIVYDGWSKAVFYRELSALYEAFSSDRPSPLPALSIQYADYAQWQRQRLKGKVLEAQMSYWRKRLEGAPPVLELPTDRPHPPAQSYRGATQTFNLSKDLAESLKTLSLWEGVTLYMMLLAAFKTLLYRYTNSEDIVVGTLIANRTRVETEGLIGFFANTLALRTDLSGTPTFRELLGRVRETTLGAYSHQDVPFEKLVEELQPERTLSHSPLFQVVFVLQNAPRGLRLRGLTTRAINIYTETAKFDLALSMVEWEGGLKGFLAYSTDLFEAETIQRMAGHLETILNGIVANPDQRIYELPILTKEERHKILVEWNDSEAEYPRDKCIHELFQEQALRTPNAVAVELEGRELTYQELNERANQVAHYLRKQGVRPEVMVGICVERSHQMIIGLLAILKAGGAYVPLDPDDPVERLEFMMRDTAAPILLTQGHLVSRLPATETKMVCLDRDWEKIGRESTENPESKAIAENLVYVIYTSGSTGRPKGVKVEHRGVVRLVKTPNYADLSSGKVVFHFSSITFDAATFKIWGCLLNGGRILLFPANKPSLEELGRLIREKGITTLWLISPLFHQMVDSELESLSEVRQLLAGGDVLSVKQVKKFLQRHRRCLVINAYGPTENSAFSCYYCMPEVGQMGSSVPIGRPVANTKVYILDPHLGPVPIGVSGELYVGGDGLARGYLNRPELTAAKFIPNPFGGERGSRIYKTGDLARYLADGNIEFMGRLDHQVKIRGYRIECDEIEHWLREHPDIHEVVVLAAEIGRGDKELAAYIVGRNGLSISELRKYLGEYLPAYMIPSAFVFLDKLPLTSNGKIDGRALPAPVFFEESSREEFVPPGNPDEEMIATIWAELLKVERVGLHDNFFALGGHSLLATQVVSRIANASNVNISLRSFFEAPTVSGLAELIQESRHVDGREYNSDKAGYEAGEV